MILSASQYLTCAIMCQACGALVQGGKVCIMIVPGLCLASTAPEKDASALGCVIRLSKFMIRIMLPKLAVSLFPADNLFIFNVMSQKINSKTNMAKSKPFTRNE